jgi:hypothetical protein
MNSNGKSMDIVVKCGEGVQALVMYHNVGVTLVRGRRDDDGMIIVVSTENLAFVDYPELVGLYFDHAWNLEDLQALLEPFCWDGELT